ncbi:MAG: acylphosphatase [Desulfovibrio sp.]|jgi:acylphosphatase
MPTYTAEVDGRVQGVCFRAWTLEVARALRLTGYVRNLPDGRVQAVAQGPREALERFARELERGAPLSRVSEVRGRFAQDEEKYQTFEVRY